MNRRQLLEQYMKCTKQLVELFSATSDSFDTTKLEQLLQEREQLIAAFEQTPAAAKESYAELLAEIQTHDLAFQTRLRETFQHTRAKVSDLQSKRRASQAYGSRFGYGAAFIDRKK